MPELAMTRFAIAHTYEEYDGDHTNKNWRAHRDESVTVLFQQSVIRDEDSGIHSTLTARVIHSDCFASLAMTGPTPSCQIASLRSQ